MSCVEKELAPFDLAVCKEKRISYGYSLPSVKSMADRPVGRIVERV